MHNVQRFTCACASASTAHHTAEAFCFVSCLLQAGSLVNKGSRMKMKHGELVQEVRVHVCRCMCLRVLG